MTYKKTENVSHVSIVQIILSFFFSILFIWAVGYFFCNSLLYYQYDEELNKFIHSPGIIYHHRNEGFAKTYKGLFGVNALEDMTKDRRKKIAVWGDSFVEAHQVNDHEKTPQVLTAKLSDKGFGENLMSFGVGMSEDSVADYYFDIPKYEKLTKDIVYHFIIITNIKDMLPDQSTDDKRGVFKSDPYRLYQNDWRPVFQMTKKIFIKYHLSPLWWPARSIFLSLNKKHRFTPGSIRHESHMEEQQEIEYPDKFLFDAWSFLLIKLREQTELPIVLVYSPQIPKIQDGRISVEDDDADRIALLTDIARKYNISVLNSTDAFISYYKRTGLFPRGFPNSKPGSGHFNKNGHDIVSEIIMNHIIREAKI